ncbi:unnamed protein product, partial [Calicophoron daubneyi]
RSGSLLITAFDKEVDQYFDVIELNKFYSVSGGTLKRANGNFNTTGHQFEMVLTNSSLVTACPIEDSNDIPVLQFRFVPIKDIATLEQGSIVDVVGITHQTGALQSVLTKAPKRKLKKRDVELVDHSRILIRLTLWGEQPANFDGGQHPSVVVKEGELVDNRACGDRSGSLLITAFDKEVDQYFDVIELNKFYSVSGGTLKRANGNFNTTGHQFEMVLTNSSLVTACPIEDSNDIPVLQFRFVPIKDIATLEQGSIVDVVGITHQTGALQSVLTKAPKRKLKKRDVELVEHSRILIRLTLWGEQPANFDGGQHPSVVVKEGELVDNRACGDRSGSLLITAFDKEVDQYFDVIELNKFYSVSGGTLKRANGNFNTTGHQFEMVLTNSSLVTACPIEDSNDIPVLQFRFVPIKDIATLEQGSIVDVVGITHQTGALQSVLTKAPKRKLKKRDVELVDHSRILIRLTLWGEQPANFDGGQHPSVVVKEGELVDNRACGDRSGSLLITAFDKEVDQYFDVIELNKFYSVSGGTLKRANGNFNTTGHQFEMVLTNSSLVTACPIEDSNDIPVLQFRFVPIKDIATLEQGSIVDVVGITHQTGALQSVLTKAPKRKLKKRDVELVDHSRILIRLTLWGEQPANFDGGQHPSVVVKEGELVDNRACGDRSGSLLITAFDKEVDQYFDVIELNKFYSVSGGTLKRANGNFNTTGHQFEMVLTNSSLVTACPIEDSNDIPVLQFRFVPIKDIATLEQGSIVDVVGITHQTGALQSVLTKAPKRKLKKRDVELVDHSRILIRLTLWGEQPANFDGGQHPSVVVKEGELVDNRACGDRSGSLLITAFDKEVDQYFDVIELNKFYSVSGGTLKRANGNFNTTGHQFEMVLTNSSLVTACPIEDSNDIPVLQFRFVPIKDIATLEQGSIVDVVGITHQTGALQSVLTKAPKRKLKKRDVELVDHSRILIRLTLWGEQPANFDGGQHPSVVVKEGELVDNRACGDRSGSLLITAFDKEVDQYFDVIELNKFYSVSGGTLKRANGNFNTTGHQFEMVLTNSSLVTACPIEDSNDIPVLQFRFVPIKDIATLEQGSIVDVVGITHQTGALQSVLTKAPKRKLKKRDVELVDHSRILIRLTLWGEQPANFDGGQHPSVVVKEGELVDNRACGDRSGSLLITAFDKEVDQYFDVIELNKFYSVSGGTLKRANGNFNTTGHQFEMVLTNSSLVTACPIEDSNDIPVLQFRFVPIKDIATLEQGSIVDVVGITHQTGALQSVLTKAPKRKLKKRDVELVDHSRILIRLTLWGEQPANFDGGQHPSVVVKEGELVDNRACGDRSGSLLITAFDKEVDQYFDVIELNKFYSVSGGTLKRANGNFNTTGHQFEMVLTNSSLVTACPIEDSNDIPVLQFRFVPIKDIATLEQGSIVDVVGITHQTGALQSVLTKAPKRKLKKRDVELVDHSRILIRLTLWGEQPANFDGGQHPSVVVKEGELVVNRACNDRSGSLLITAFDKEVDQYFDVIELNKFYSVSGGTLKRANGNFNTTGHQFEMVLTNSSLVTACPIEDSNDIPVLQFRFVPIKDIATLEQGSIVDVVGITHQTGALQSVLTKAPKRKLKKRDVELVDHSRILIRLTLWGEQPANFDGGQHPSVVVKEGELVDNRACGDRSGSLLITAFDKEVDQYFDVIELNKFYSVSGGTLKRANGNFNTTGHQFEMVLTNSSLVTACPIEDSNDIPVLQFRFVPIKDIATLEQGSIVDVVGITHQTGALQSVLTKAPKRKLKKRDVELVDHSRILIRLTLWGEQPANFDGGQHPSVVVKEGELVDNRACGDRSGSLLITAFDKEVDQYFDVIELNKFYSVSGGTLKRANGNFNTTGHQFEMVLTNSSLVTACPIEDSNDIPVLQFRFVPIKDIATLEQGSIVDVVGITHQTGALQSVLTKAPKRKLKKRDVELVDHSRILIRLTLWGEQPANFDGGQHPSVVVKEGELVDNRACGDRSGSLLITAFDKEVDQYFDVIELNKFYSVSGGTLKRANGNFNTTGHQFEMVLTNSSLVTACPIEDSNDIPVLQFRFVPIKDIATLEQGSIVDVVGITHQTGALQSVLTKAPKRKLKKRDVELVDHSRILIRLTLWGEQPANFDGGQHPSVVVKEGELVVNRACNDRSGSLLITAFDKEVDQYFDVIELNKFYSVSGGTLKRANGNFNTTGHQFEMVLTNSSLVTACPIEDSNDIPVLQFRFVPIKDIATLEQGSIVDVVGITHQTGALQSVLTKAPKRKLKKRDVELVDHSRILIRLTLWGEQPANFDGGQHPSVVVKEGELVDNRACGDRSGSLLITAFDKEVDQYFDVIELNKFYSVSGGTLKRANGNFNTTGHQFEMVLTNSSLVTACPIEDSNDIPVLQFRFVPIKDIATLEQGSIVDVVGITHQTGALQSVLTKAPKRKLKKRDVELVDHSRILIRLTLWGEQPANFDGGQHPSVVVKEGELVDNRACGDRSGSLLITAFDKEVDQYFDVIELNKFYSVSGGTLKRANGNFNTTGHQFEMVLTNSSLVTACPIEDSNDIPVLQFRFVPIKDIATLEQGSIVDVVGITHQTGALQSVLTKAPKRKLKKRDVELVDHSRILIRLTLWGEQPANFDGGQHPSVVVKEGELVDNRACGDRSGSLLITAFDKEVDQYFDVIELNKFYSVSGGTLKRANGNFNTTGHQFEMVLTNSSLVTACPIEDSNDIPVLQFRFVPIKDIATLEQGSIVDVVGITHQTGALQSVLTKAPKRKLKKRDVELVDHSRILIRLTLWGEQPANFDGGQHPSVVVKEGELVDNRACGDRSGSLLITAFDKEVDQYFDVIELNKFYSVSGGTLKRANGNFNTTGHQFEMVLTNSSLVTACPIEDSNDIPVLQFRFVPIKDIATLEQGSIVDVVGITHQTGALQSVLTKAPKRKLKKRDVELVDHSRILIRLTLWGEQPANFDGGQHPSVVVKEGELVDNRACGDRSGSLLITAFDKEVDQYFDVIELNKFYSVSGGTLKRANGNFNTTGHQFEMVLTNSSLVTACPIEDSNDIPVLQFRFVPIKDIATLEQGSIVDVVGITHQTGALQSVLTKAPKRKLKKRDVELVDHSRILIRLTLWGEQPANFDGGQHPSVVVKEGELVDNRACGDRSGSLLITAFDKEVDQYFDVIELNKFYSVSGGTLKRANGNFNTTGHQFEMVLTNSSLVTACPIEDSNDIPVLQFRFVPIKDIATLEQGSIVDVVGITHQTGALQSVLTKAPKRKLKKRDVELVDHSRILIRLTLWGEQPANFDGGQHPSVVVKEGELVDNRACGDRSGSLLITAFDKEVDQYFDVIELNKFYSVSDGTLKRANGNFNTTGHQFEMVLTNSSLVTACPIEDSNDIPVLQFRFVPIKDIATLEQGSIVDVVGITHQTGALQSVLTKAPKRKLKKRDVELVDHSRILIRLTLWGEQPANFDGGQHPSVVVKEGELVDNRACGDRSGSLLITAFDKEVDQYFDVIELNKFYSVSGGTLKRANGNFNTTGHQFEMVLTNSSLVTACPIEDSNDIPVLQFRFVPIKDIATLEQGSIVDVVGITHQTGALQSVLTKAPKRKLKKRDVELVDHLRILIRLTLWGEQPANFDGGQHPSVVVKEGELVDNRACGDRSGSLLITAFDKEVDQYFDVIELNKFYSVSGGTLKRANGNFNTTGHQFEMVLTNSSLVTACPIEDSNDIPVLQFRFVPIKDIATLEQGSIVDVVGITHQTGALQSVLTKAPKRKLKKRDVELVDHSRILIRLTLWGEQPANFDGGQHPSVVVKEGELVDNRACGDRSGSLLITAFDKEVDQYFDVIELNKFYSVSGGTLKRANGNFNTTGHQFEMVLTNSSLVTACPIEDSNDIPVLQFRFVPIKDIATLEQGSIVDVVGITHQTGALQSVLTKAPKRKLKKRDVELVDHSRILIRLTLWGEQPANFDGGQHPSVVVKEGELVDNRACGDRSGSLLITAFDKEVDQYFDVIELNKFYSVSGGTLKRANGNFNTTGHQFEMVLTNSSLVTACPIEDSNDIPVLQFRFVPIKDIATLEQGSIVDVVGITHQTGALQSVLTKAPKRKLKKRDVELVDHSRILIRLTLWGEQPANFDGGQHPSVVVKEGELVDNRACGDRSGSLLITAFDKEVDQYFDVIELNKFYSVSGGTLKRANGNFNTTGHQFEMVLTNSSLVTACPIEDSNDIPVLQFRFVPIKDIATLEQGSIVDVVGITHQTGALQSVLTKAPKRKLKKRDVELVDHSRILIRLTLWGEQPANFDGGQHPSVVVKEGELVDNRACGDRSGSLLITAFDKEVDQYFDVIELNKFYSVSGGTLKRANGNFNTTGHQFEMVLTNSSLVTACPIEDSNDIPVLQFRFVPIKDIATLEQGSIVDVVGITHQTGALQSVLTKAPKRKLKKRDVELVDHSRILIRLTLWGEQPANFDGGQHPSVVVKEGELVDNRACGDRSGSLLITAFDKEVDQYFDVIELNKFYSVSGGTLKRANGNFNTTGHQFEMVLTNSSLVTACPIEDSNDIPVLQFRFVPIKDIATLEQGSIVDVVGITHQTGALQSVLTKAPKRKLKKRDVELVDHSRILIRLTLWGEQPANFDGGQHPSVVVKEGELVDNRACGDRSGSLLITAFDKEVDQYFDVIELNKFYSVSGGTLKRANGNFNTTGHQFEMVLTNSSLVTACPIEDSNDIPVLQFRFVPIKDIATLEQGSIVDVVGITHQTGALQSVLTKAPKRKLKKRDVELVDHSRILIRLTLWGEQPANFDGGQHPSVVVKEGELVDNRACGDRSGSLLITAFDKEVDQYFDVIELNKFYSVSGGTLKRANGNFNTTGHQFEMVLTNSSLVTACPIEDSNDIPVLQFRFVPIKDIATLEQGSIVDVVGITHQTGALQSVLTKAPKRKLKKRDVELVDHSRILIRLTLWGEQPANFDGGQHPSVVVKEGELVDNRACGDRSGSLLITAFDKEVDQYFDVIELNKFYSVSGGTLKPANGNFNTTGHQFEMVLTNSSLVTACPIEDSNDIPVLQFRFVPIKDIATLEQGSIVDVVGITHQTGALQSVLTKAPKRKLKKRDVELVDHSRILIRLTLWGEQPANFDGGQHPSVVVKEGELVDNRACGDRSGSLLITAFDKEVDQYFDVIELNKFYSVSGGTLKRANGNFNTTGHQFEMVLTNSSLVTACPIEDSNDIPVLQFRFVPIKDIATLEQGSIVDVVGITHQTGALQSVLTKAPKRKLKKRDVELVDHSRILIRLTLWGEQPANFDGGQHPSVVVKEGELVDNRACGGNRCGLE